MKGVWFITEKLKGPVPIPDREPVRTSLISLFDQDLNEIPSSGLDILLRRDGKICFCSWTPHKAWRPQILGYYEFENRTQLVDWLHLMRQGRTEEARAGSAKFKRDLVAIYKDWISRKGDRKC